MCYFQKSYRLFLILLLVFSSCQLMAQKDNNKKNANKSGAIVGRIDTLCHADSLQRVIDGLQLVINSQQRLSDSLSQVIRGTDEQLQIQKQKEAALLTVNDSLKKVIYDQYAYLLNYSVSLLYKRYNSRVDDIERMLRGVPDSLKRADREQLLADAKAMIDASNAPSQDMRNRVFGLLRTLPPETLDEQTKKDIQTVLSNVGENYPQYNPVQHALAMLEALPKDIAASDNNYDVVRNLLSVYKASNDEIKETLENIQNNGKNIGAFIEDSWPNFVKQLKNTNYYKIYYSKDSHAWTIRYLNDVIDEALQRLQNAKSRVNLEDLIKKL